MSGYVSNMQKFAKFAFPTLLASTLAFHATASEIGTEKVRINADIVAKGLANPWGMDFLPDGAVILTERGGAMRIIIGDRDAARLLDAFGAARVADVAALAAACDAIIDFTHADAVVAHAKALEGARCAWVIGASGVTPAGRDAIVDAARARPVSQAMTPSPATRKRRA